MQTQSDGDEKGAGIEIGWLVGSKLYYQMNILTKWLGIDILILFISYLLTTLNNKNKINSNFWC